MLIKCETFEFNQPQGWAYTADSKRHIFHSPNRDELIVSGASIQEDGVGLETVVSGLFHNAENAIRKAAAHPALVIRRDFNRELQLGAVEVWTLLSETKEGDVIFYQAVVRNLRSVLIVTFEAANHDSAKSQFAEFLRSITGD